MGAISRTILSSQEELCSTSTVFSSSQSARFAQVTTRVSSPSQGARGEEVKNGWSTRWAPVCGVVLCRRGRRGVLSPIPGRTFGDSLALVVKHTARPQGCCLEPFLSLRNLGFWQKWNVVTPRARFGVAYRSLTVYGCTQLLGSCSVSVVDFCLRVEQSGIS